MSCVGFLNPEQRAALAAATARAAVGEVLAEHPVPPVTDGTRHRIRLLAADRQPGIRASAAAHRHAPPDVLLALADDPAESVRCAVARNESAPQVVLRRLAADRSPTVRGWVAAHPGVPPDLLDALAGDADETVPLLATWNRARAR